MKCFAHTCVEGIIKELVTVWLVGSTRHMTIVTRAYSRGILCHLVHLEPREIEGFVCEMVDIVSMNTLQTVKNGWIEGWK